MFGIKMRISSTNCNENENKLSQQLQFYSLVDRRSYDYFYHILIRAQYTGDFQIYCHRYFREIIQSLKIAMLSCTAVIHGQRTGSRDAVGMTLRSPVPRLMSPNLLGCCGRISKSKRCFPCVRAVQTHGHTLDLKCLYPGAVHHSTYTRIVSHVQPDKRYMHS
jgi:hypothetical protein